LIRPAVDGTLAIMKAARLNKVKRVVVTSSVAAIFYQNIVKDTFTADDWSDIKITEAYAKSKTLAE
jgi:dihydroflavonol-4-reductase